MKRTIMVMCTLAITVLIVSAVSVVPNVKADDEQDAVSNIFENFNFGLFNRLKDKVIAEVGMDVYNETYVSIKYIVYDHLALDEGQGFCITDDWKDYELHEDTVLPRTGFYEGLVQVAVVIILLMVVLFGQVGPGFELGVLCAMMVLVIPCFLFAAVEGAFSTVGIVTGLLLGGQDVNGFIRDYGVVGLLVFVCLLLPLIIIISIVVYPLMTVLFTVDILACILMEALEIVDDMTPGA